jgi:hypothetical protein
VTSSTTLPVIADADTGYGDERAVAHRGHSRAAGAWRSRSKIRWALPSHGWR